MSSPWSDGNAFDVQDRSPRRAGARHGGCTTTVKEVSMLTILLLVLLVLALAGGGFGYGRFGAAGWSPAAIILIVLLLLYFTGNLH
jgi:hypothetical protein